MPDQTVEIDIVSVSQTSLPHGKVQVTLVFEHDNTINFEEQLTAGDKTGIVLPSHHNPA